MPDLPSVQIDRLPASLEAFLELRDTIASTPQGGVATAIVALLLYAEDKALGRQCLTIALDRSCLVEGPDGYKGRRLRKVDLQRLDLQLQSQPYLPRAYLYGTSPRKGYTLPDPPYTVICSDNPYSGAPENDTFKVFVATSGAASPRPVTLKRNDRGIWKVYEWSSLIVGVQPAKLNVEDDL
jgi:hypothetical protein